MQISNRSVAFSVRLPRAVGSALLDAQRPGLTYRQIAQYAIAEYAKNPALIEQLANSQDTEKAA